MWRKLLNFVGKRSARNIAADHAPTIAAARVATVPIAVTPAAHSPPIVGPAPTMPQRPAAPDASAIARAFVDWAITHKTSGTHGRAIQVDHLWWLASADFAAVHCISMPPRRVFLGALQKLPGVQVEYDRRVYSGAGRMPRKTTFYRLDAVQPAEQLSLPLAA